MAVETETKRLGENYLLLRSPAYSPKRIGIYARGSCHLAALFAAAPLIERVLGGTCCIVHDGMQARCRSDLELQTLQDLPQEWLDPVIEKLHLGADYFRPQLFEPTFTIPAADGPEEFPKTVVVLHISPDSNGRTLYRHKKHGFLVDPGGGWLRSLNSVLGNPLAVTWFRENFEQVGMIGVDQFIENYTKIIGHLRQRARAHVMVFNTLTVEPGSLTHNYQFVKHRMTLRWREFHIALTELSRTLDFSVLDMDRILKLAGIRTQTEFAHFLPHQNRFVAREAFRLLNDLGIFGT
jgi:hypothetical protein